METVIVDAEFMKRGKAARGMWSRRQLALVGIKWPLKRGWYRRAIGTTIPKEDAEEFLRLKGVHHGENANQKEINFKNPHNNYCPHCGQKIKPPSWEW